MNVKGHDKEKPCAITVLQETWKLLKSSKNLDEAKNKFRELIPKLILGE